MKSPEKRAENAERMRLGNLIRHSQRERLSADLVAENRRFSDRLRFDQPSRVWKSQPEPRSLPPSTWPPFEEAVKKWGIGRFRMMGAA